MENRIIYDLDRLSRKELEHDIDAIWNELHTSDSIRVQGNERGIDFSALPPRTDLIFLETDRSGFSPAEAAIIVAFAPLAAKIARDIWDNFILPRLIQRHGQSALRERKERDA